MLGFCFVLFYFGFKEDISRDKSLWIIKEGPGGMRGVRISVENHLSADIHTKNLPKDQYVVLLHLAGLAFTKALYRTGSVEDALLGLRDSKRF